MDLYHPVWPLKPIPEKSPSNWSFAIICSLTFDHWVTSAYCVQKQNCFIMHPVCVHSLISPCSLSCVRFYLCMTGKPSLGVTTHSLHVLRKSWWIYCRVKSWLRKVAKILNIFLNKNWLKWIFCTGLITFIQRCIKQNSLVNLDWLNGHPTNHSYLANPPVKGLQAIDLRQGKCSSLLVLVWPHTNSPWRLTFCTDTTLEACFGKPETGTVWNECFCFFFCFF